MAPDTKTTTATAAADSPFRNLLLFAGILLIAVNLRAALASVSPLLTPIGTALGLGPLGLTVLATIPVVCFAALAPVSIMLQRRIGLEAAMMTVLVLLAAGLLIRVLGGAAALFAGTVMGGAAIAMGNVLLPGLVKRDFPTRVGLVTGCYTTVMTTIASVAAAVSVPVADATPFAWRGALGLWAVPAIVAAAVWAPQLAHGAHRLSHTPTSGAFRKLARSPLAWAVTMFMGLQSLGFYSILSWLPAILHAHGINPTMDGIMLSTTTLVAIPAALVTPSLATRSRDQRLLLASLLAIVSVGYVGLMLAPAAAPWVWVVFIGIGQGACFPLALTLMVLRTGGPAEAMALSAFSQMVGYAVSIAGPLGLGVIHTLSGHWWPSVAFLVILQAPTLGFGLAAARPRTIRF